MGGLEGQKIKKNGIASPCFDTLTCTHFLEVILSERNVTHKPIKLVVLHCEIQHSAFQIRLSRGTTEGQSVMIISDGLSGNPIFWMLALCKI